MHQCWRCQASWDIRLEELGEPVDRVKGTKGKRLPIAQVADVPPEIIMHAPSRDDVHVAHELYCLVWRSQVRKQSRRGRAHIIQG